MELGKFSISLSVADVAESRAFYEKLGFTVLDGKQAEGWLILTNDSAVIGIFQGMFEGNILTFNPKDVRTIQEKLEDAGLELTERAAPGEGPAYITLLDPDGNAILIDQHPEDYEYSPETID